MFLFHWQIDPYSAKMVDGSSPEPATEVEATAETRRQSLESELHRYRRSSFSPGVSASSVFATEKEGGACTLVAYVSCEHVNLRNWWSGSWMGRYEVAYDDGSAKIRVSGTVKVRAHYFESGNMQLETSQDVPPTCIGSDEGAAGIMSVIKTSEDSLHQQLEEMYANMGDSLKAARRARPIKADKFAWNIHQVRMVKNLVKP
jgi:capping protein alpha